VPQNELLASHLTHYTGYPATCGRQFCPSVDDTETEGLCFLLLIDCYKLGESRVWSTVGLNNLDGNNHTGIAFFNLSNKLSAKFETAAMQRGIRGIFYEDVSLDMLVQGVKTILTGEFWYSRKAMSQYIQLKLSQSSIQPNEVLPLTHRQKEILQMLIAGRSNEEIAAALFLSRSTVKSHIYSLFKKINVPSRLQAVLWASKHLPYI
jgi:LuxR family transcriptional regulator, positive regulator of biofilm formation